MTGEIYLYLTQIQDLTYTLISARDTRLTVVGLPVLSTLS